MNTKELRLGNYVIDVRTMELVTIHALTEDKINHDSIQHFKPKRLTTDWLHTFVECRESMANGTNVVCVGLYGLSLYIPEGETSYYTYSSTTKLECVHQLQNHYFAKCYEELTLKKK
jgi:hypothetical protein